MSCITINHWWVKKNPDFFKDANFKMQWLAFNYCV